MPAAHYQQLTDLLRENAVLDSVGANLSWDQETKMPPRGSALRADQLQLLSGMVHERHTSPRLGELIEACEADGSLMADDAIKANLREIRREFDKATKLPKSLVQEIARCASLGMEAWKAARADSDFKTFKPWLEKTVELSRQKANCYGVPAGGEIYDPLLDEWEPGMTAARTAAVFGPLREFTVELLQKVTDSGVKVDLSPSTIRLPLDQQRAFAHHVCEAIGFDFTAGRMDDSTHPFCEGVGPGDTRMTNRYRDDGWLDSISSATHESGHGMYEQGIPKDRFFGQPLGKYISLGVHESQSRLWENMVGRSRPFWEWATGVAKEIFGAPLARVTGEQVYRAANTVEPSFIRVEADEVTYNLHIMMRFDLERAMVTGDLAIDDLPGVWNDRMKSDFGLTVPEDRLGCLQDVHWSMGSLGYFPTYTFGNIYAAQFWEAMERELPDREQKMAKGQFGEILAWLRTNIHAHGRRYIAEDLCTRICGEGMNSQALMRHLEKKVHGVYGV